MNIDKLDKVFSQYIRLRDSKPYEGRYFRCISCGQIKPYEEGDAGHFVPRTNMATRFDEQNVWTECIYDNRFNTNHLEGFRKNLVGKIGEAGVDELTKKGHQLRKYSRSEIEEMIRIYKEKIKALKNGTESL